MQTLERALYLSILLPGKLPSAKAYSSQANALVLIHTKGAPLPLCSHTTSADITEMAADPGDPDD
jgi:hypothetical protein